MRYVPRLADAELRSALARSGAVLIEGPKACGKTETALQQSNSMVRVDTDPSVSAMLAVDPSLVLEGEVPRLFDEWQLQPTLWNLVRRAVDERHARGQFILTGSTAPVADATRHSGAGRVARVRMHTMTLSEIGRSSADVSLRSIFDGESPRAVDPGLGFDELLERIASGGWPLSQELSIGDALAGARDYVAAIADVEITALGVRRDPVRMRRLMTALARNTATEVTVSTLARDEASLSRDAVRDYLAALSRIFVIDDQPAWSAHLRSSATLRKEPKRHFCDPSLAVAAIGADVAALKRELRFTGQLFESFVVHELRALGRQFGASVFHARDSAGREVDAVLQTPDGRWAAFEIKLGVTPEILDGAAASLRAFADSVDTDRDPSLTVITGRGPSYRRADGINVVAIGALAP